MPIVDRDRVHVRRTARGAGDTNIEVEFEWTDAAGVSKGVFTVSYQNTAEMVEFLASQTMEDVIRAVLAQAIDQADNTLRRQFFASMAGKTYEVVSRSVPVV